MENDSGLLEFKTEAEVKDYMENIGLRFEFGCVKEHNPISCHSLAQWYENFKRSPKDCAAVLKANCFDRKYGDSCFKYGTFKLFGKTGVSRDPLESYQVFEYGCNSAEHVKCCQAAGRLAAEGIAAHSPKLDTAIPLFERGCRLGYGESCFHLGGAAIALVQELERKTDRIEADKNATTLRRKALDAWCTGCRIGHRLSCLNVARMYSIGDGVPVDKDKAAEFSQLAEKIAADRGEHQTNVMNT